MIEEVQRPSGEEIEVDGIGMIRFTQRASSDAAFQALDRGLKTAKRDAVLKTTMELETGAIPVAKSIADKLKEAAIEKLLSPFFNNASEINDFSKTDDGTAILLTVCCDGLGENKLETAKKVVSSFDRLELMDLVWRNSGLFQAKNSNRQTTELAKQTNTETGSDTVIADEDARKRETHQ